MSTETTSAKILPIIIISFLLIISISGIIIWLKYEQGDPLEIYHPTSEKWDGTIYIGGAVHLPGYYPFTHEDTIETLVQAAGGITDNYSPDNVILLLDDSKQEQHTQKIDINRAGKYVWKPRK